MKKKVMLAMSGGLDSSVSLLLLKEEYDVVGVTLNLYNNNDYIKDCTKTCCSLSDVEDAKSVATKYNVNHYTLNFKDKFKTHVIDRFADEYYKGRTPNPCIDCNRFIKFKEMLSYAISLDCDYLATGHYARIKKDEKTGRYLLMKALDLSKDQSYVLYSLTQEQLSRILFPMGEIIKKDARIIAKDNGFINAQKPDSQDICFVPDGDYAGFLERYTSKKSEQGNFIDTNGNILGKHNGITHYTLGQRKGLGIALGRPVYVVNINPEENTVTLGNESELLTSELTAKDINLISIEAIEKPLKVFAKTRYKQTEQPCTITQIDENTVHCVFDKPQRAITPGQAVVFYDGDIVVGGGTIV